MDAFSRSSLTTETTTAPSLARKLGEGVPAESKFQGRTKNVRRRCGAAVAELAICLPLLALVVFGSIEACNVIFLKQTLVEAAYEGALIGSQPRATQAKIEHRVRTVLQARKIEGVNVSVDGNGASFDSLPAGGLFTVHVDATVAGNVHVPIRFATFETVESDVVGHKQE